jgi:hypothetical protein
MYDQIHNKRGVTTLYQDTFTSLEHDWRLEEQGARSIPWECYRNEVTLLMELCS